MSNYPASPPLSEKRFFRKNRKEKKVKRRKSRKRSLKKSISWSTRLSSSEDEFDQVMSPKSLMLGDRTPLGPEESDCETALSSSDDRQWSSSSDSFYTSMHVSVREAKQVKKSWSGKDIVREVQKELESENLKVVTEGKDIEQGSAGPTPGLRITIPKGTAICRVRASKSRSKSRNNIRQREDVSPKLDDPTSLEGLSTASSSNECKALSCYNRRDITQPLEYGKYNSLDSSKMKEAALDVRQSNIKIPKTMKEVQVWHNNMMKGNKYFTQDFLDAGIIRPNTLGIGPSALESQSVVELSSVH